MRRCTLRLKHKADMVSHILAEIPHRNKLVGTNELKYIGLLTAQLSLPSIINANVSKWTYTHQPDKSASVSLHQQHMLTHTGFIIPLWARVSAVTF